MKNQKIKVIGWLILIIIVIFGFNYWGTRNGDRANSINETHGIPKTHGIQVGRPTKNESHVESHHHSMSTSHQHLKDVPGDDSDPKKG